jgi:hypothetical protein
MRVVWAYLRTGSKHESCFKLLRLKVILKLKVFSVNCSSRDRLASGALRHLRISLCRLAIGNCARDCFYACTSRETTKTAG